MTSPASNTEDRIEIQYEGAAPTFGGFDSADFAIDRPGHHILEVNLRLSSDARALFETALRAADAPDLDAHGIANLMRELGQRQYRDLARHDEILPIITLRASHIDASAVNEILSGAGLL
jgi:hypothetical protein